MTNLRRFNKGMIHTGDQPGPPSPYMSERSHSAKMSSGTSKFLVGNAHNQCASELNNRKVNPIGGDGPIGAKWMGDRCDAESSRPWYGFGRKDQGRSGFDYRRRSRTVCHTHFRNTEI